MPAFPRGPTVAIGARSKGAKTSTFFAVGLQPREPQAESVLASCHPTPSIAILHTGQTILLSLSVSFMFSA